MSLGGPTTAPGLPNDQGEETFRKRLALFKWRGVFRKVLVQKMAERRAELAAEAAHGVLAGRLSRVPLDGRTRVRRRRRSD